MNTIWYLHIHLVCAKLFALLAIKITFPFAIYWLEPPHYSGSDPKDGFIYTGKFTITETTTVVARNRFLVFWSKPEDNTYRFESVQNTAVTYVTGNIDLETLKQIFALCFMAFVAFGVAIKKFRELFRL